MDEGATEDLDLDLGFELGAAYELALATEIEATEGAELELGAAYESSLTMEV